MAQLNRRQMLKGSVAGSFALGAAGLFGTAHAAGAVKFPKKWDETVDVIVMVNVGFRAVGVVVNVSFALMKMFVKFRSMRVIVLFMEMVCIAMLPVRVLMRINWLAL